MLRAEKVCCPRINSPCIQSLKVIVFHQLQPSVLVLMLCSAMPLLLMEIGRVAYCIATLISRAVEISSKDQGVALGQ